MTAADDLLNASLARREKALAASAALLHKADDCGCGCEGKGDCPPPEDTRREFVPVPGLVNASREAVNLKAAAHLYAMGERLFPYPDDEVIVPRLATKVGMFGSHDPVTQAAEAVVSYAIPGDMSDVRSPVRSTAYEAITPGGGGGRSRLRSIGRQIVRRCPPGFEHGGRFANATYTNCGALLFTSAIGPDGEDLVGSATTTARRTVGGQAVGRATIRNVGAGLYGDSPIIRRNPNIPEVGKVDRSKVDAAVEAETVAAGNGKDGFMRFIRKDGIVVKPVAGMDRLLRQKDHPEIVGSTLVMSVTRPTNIGGDELKLLGNGLAEIHYVIPGGSSLIVKPRKPLTPRRASAIRRDLERLRAAGDEHGRALKMLAEKHQAELSMVTKFKNMDDANDMVVIERGRIRRTVQKWAYLTWYANNAPGRPKTGAAWRLIDGEA